MIGRPLDNLHLILGFLALSFAILAWLRHQAFERADKMLGAKSVEIAGLLARQDELTQRMQRADSLETESRQASAQRDVAVAREVAAREALDTHKAHAEQRLQQVLQERETAFAKERAAILALKKEAEERFQAMASEALSRNNQQFLALAEEALGKKLENADGGLKALMSPVNETFQQFRDKIGEIEKTRSEDRAAMVEQMRNVAEQIKENQDAARKLAFALKANPKTRGRWGEEQLRNILELSGLSKFADFEEQFSVKGEEGLLRPDVRVRLPGGRMIVIDSKVALDAYLDGVDAVDEVAREACLVRHAKQIRAHMESLASKQYWRNVGDAVDFVAMFIPGENFFAAAAERDAELLSQALERKVMIVTPVTLTALLKAVAYGWRQEESALNARAIADLGQTLYDRLAKMGEHLGRLGSRISASVASYNELVGSIETQVMPGARKFLDYGAGGKEIPQLDSLESTPRALVTGRDLRLPPKAGE